MKTKYYLLQVIGDVEPVLHGPFDTDEARDAHARLLRDEDRSDLKDGLYQLDVDAHGVPAVNAYCGGDFNEEGEN
jgi:hypothetical protein